MKSITLFLIIVILSCAGRTIVDPLIISDELNLVKKNINDNRNYLYKIKTKRVGKSGFYYILDNNGKVIFHPQALLIGRSFKDFWFANKDKFFKINPSVHCNHHCVADSKNKIVLEYLEADKQHLGFV